jgi:hypothetical protein
VYLSSELEWGATLSRKDLSVDEPRRLAAKMAGRIRQRQKIALYAVMIRKIIINYVYIK